MRGTHRPLTSLSIHKLMIAPNCILCADSFDIMPQIEDKSVDLILTDPPYDETTHKGGMFTKEIKFGNVDFESINIIPVIKEFLRICNKWVLVFCPIETLGLVKKEYSKEYVRGGIWDRIINSPQISGDRPAQAREGIAILHNEGKKSWNGGGKAGLWRAWTERGCKVHITQKPLLLIKQLIQDFSNKDDLVLDPFSGSMTTAIACIATGRRYICIEKDQGYYENGLQRIEVYNRQGRIQFKGGERE
jgi:site-specific DNA-methyltransferase (adenine-specific)